MLAAVVLALAGLPGTTFAAAETINITCWEGYADKAVIDAFKSLVKEKYKMDVEVKTTYATGQEDFYNAAKNGTADMISPPADTAKTPRFYCFTKGSVLLSPLDMKNIPNAKHMLPFFKADKSLPSGGKTLWPPVQLRSLWTGVQH